MKIKKFLPLWLVYIHKHKQLFLFLLLQILFFQGNAQTWSLQQCIDTALVHNKNLQIGRNKIKLGGEKQNEAKANLLPKINLNADYKYFTDLPYQLMPQAAFGGQPGMYKEVQMGVPHNIVANIQFFMPLYNPQILGALQSTKTASELYNLQYKKTEEQVFFEISNLYYNAQVLFYQKAFIDSNLISTYKLLENLKLLNSQQMIKKSEISKVELQKAKLLTQLELVTSNLEQVINVLKLTMGIPFTQNIQIETEIKSKEAIHYKWMQPIDIQMSYIQNKLLEKELGTLKQLRLPTVSLFGSYGQSGFGYDGKPKEFLNFYPVTFAGVQLSAPIFNGTVTKRKIDQKKLEIRNNQLQINLQSEQNQLQVENAFRQRQLSRQTIENTQSQIDLAITVYNQMVLQQKEGTASLTDVLMASNAVSEAQTSNITAIIEYLKADLELKRLTGNISLNH